MTKAELIAKIAKDAGISKVAAGKALDSGISAVMKSVASGRSVTLTGFGTFSASNRKARTGRNPQTGATIRIPAMRVPKFRAGKEFKQLVGRKR